MKGLFVWLSILSAITLAHKFSYVQSVEDSLLTHRNCFSATIGLEFLRFNFAKIMKQYISINQNQSFLFDGEEFTVQLVDKGLRPSIEDYDIDFF